MNEAADVAEARAAAQIQADMAEAAAASQAGAAAPVGAAAPEKKHRKRRRGKNDPTPPQKPPKPLSMAARKRAAAELKRDAGEIGPRPPRRDLIANASRDDLVQARVRREIFNRSTLTMLVEGLSQAHYSHETLARILSNGFDVPGHPEMIACDVPYKHAADTDFGRMYAQEGSYQPLPNGIRGLLIEGCGHHEDTDIANAFPTFMYQVFRNHRIACPSVDAYVSNRDAVIAHIMSEAPQLSRDDVKKFFLATLHGGNYLNLNAGVVIEGMEIIRDDVRLAIDAVKGFYPELVAVMRKQNRGGCERGKLISMICGIYEAQVMAAKSEFTLQQGWELGCRIHDGEHVRWSHPSTPPKFPHEQCSAFVFEKTGFNVTFVSKAIDGERPCLPRLPSFAPDPMSSDDRILLFELEGAVARLGPNERGHGRMKVEARPHLDSLAPLVDAGWRFGLFTSLKRRRLDAMRAVEALAAAGLICDPSLVFTWEDTYRASNAHRRSVGDNEGDIAEEDNERRIKPLLGRVCGWPDMKKVTLVDVDPLAVLKSENSRLQVVGAFDGGSADVFAPIVAALLQEKALEEERAELPPCELPDELCTAIRDADYFDIDSLPQLARKHKEDATEARRLIAEKMSERFVYVRSPGRLMILERRGQMFCARSLADTREGFSGSMVYLGDDLVPHNPVDIWMSLPHYCKKYTAAEFVPPGGTYELTPGTFNLFRRLAITFEEAKMRATMGAAASGMVVDKYVATLIEPQLEHIQNDICRGDADEFNFFLDWQAHLVQKPGLKTCMWCGIIGPQGAGKELAIRPLLEIFADYAYTTRDVNSVLGQYNPPEMRTNCFVFLDECTFSGNPTQAAALKGVMSGKKRRHGTKFLNEEQIHNCSSLFGASNNPILANVENQDRRSCFLTARGRYCGPQTPESKRYFDRLLRVPAWAWAYFLYTRDITNFNTREVLRTSTTSKMKAACFEPHMDFLQRCLQDAEIICESTDGCSRPFAAVRWPESGKLVISKAKLYDHYVAYCRGNRHRFQHSKVLGKQPFLDEFVNALGGGVETCRQKQGSEKPQCFRLPNLRDARQEFCGFLKEELVDWFGKEDDTDDN